MKFHLSLILTILFSLFSAQVIAADEVVEKRECLVAFGYENLEALQAELIINAKLSAVDDFFGALIVSSTAVENAVVTSDSIRVSSMGYVHLKGNPHFENGTQLGQICVDVTVEVTEEDRKKFKPIEIGGRECVNDPDMTTRQLRLFGQERAIIKALIEHDPRLGNTEEDALLQLMRNINYTEREVLKDTETFCATVKGKVVPAELEALLALGSSDLLPGNQIDSEAYNDEFDKPKLSKNWTWLREDPSRWSLEENPGQLRIRAVGGDFASLCDNYQNLLLQPAPTGDFEITTKVSAQPTQDFQQGGLIVFQDIDNWVKLDVVWSGALQGQGIELIVERDGKFVPDWPNWPKKSLKLSSNGTFLKLKKSGDTYTASYSFDDKTWTQLGSLPTKIIEPQIGIFALGGVNSVQGAPNCPYTAPEIPVDFDFFHVDFQPADSKVDSVDKSSQTETVMLTTAEDYELYDWHDGKPYITSKHSIDGDVGFIPTENNHFFGQFGTIGYEPNEIRFIRFGLYLIKKDAALIFQVNFNGDWEHRWAFDGRESYQGGYGWAKKGETLDLPVGEWVMVELDLIDQLGARPGQQLTGLAFTGADGNLVYDRVSVASDSSVSSQNSSK